MQVISEVSKQDLKEFLYYGMSVEDKNLYRQVNESQANIFQFSGATAADMVRRAIPQNFDDMISINCLSRPGSGFQFNDFVNNGENDSKYPDFIAKFLRNTHGCILTQEQIMAISTECGLNANMVRGLLKKLGKANPKQSDVEKWDKVVEKFRIAFKEKGMTESEINTVINDFVTLSKYSFNRSHAAAYTYVACETLYMARYFKSYFWASSLTYDATKLDVLKDSIKQARKERFKILPPDINSSDLHFKPVSENEISFGLNEIKGVGEEPAKQIIEFRSYGSIIDFIIKTIGTKVNKRIVLALVGAGAFDNLIPEGERRKYFKITEEFYEKKKSKKDEKVLREIWDSIVESHFLDSKTSIEEFIEMEKTYLSGSFFHGVFSDEMIAKIEKLKSLNKCLRDFDEVRKADKGSVYVPVQIKGLRTHMQRNEQLMLFMTCEDCNGEEITIPMFGSYYQHLKEKMFTGFYLLKVYPREDGGIVFGSSAWVSSPETIRSFAIRWKIS